MIDGRAAFEDVLARARERASRMLAAAPGWDLAVSVSRQLEFIAAALQARTAPSHDDAERVILGVQAARNFDDADPELAGWLMEIDHAFKRWSARPELFA